MKKVVLLVIFILGAVYLLIPGPTSINNFTGTPNSIKSGLDGDTWQNPNIAAYFSNYRRDYLTKFYYSQFSYLKIFGVVISPLKINHPPEEAFRYIRDQQESTYLEEYFYPFRDQIFVNGYEPVDVNGKLFKPGYPPDKYLGVTYLSKTTLRYYPSSKYARLITYLGIWISGFLLYYLFKKIKEKKRWT